MTLLSWKDAYSVGSQEIDDEHRHLFAVINEFYDRHHAGADIAEIEKLLTQLVFYAENHFQHEEKIMAAADYPGLAPHQAEHERLVHNIFTLAADIESGKSTVDQETLTFLKSWLLDHILQHDMEFAEFMQTWGQNGTDEAEARSEPLVS